jgi:ferric-dicitrate binding protein FerR (iron transport regulator)
MKKKFILQFKYLIIFAVVLLMMALDYFIYKRVLNRQVETAVMHHYTTINNPSYGRKQVTVYNNITAILNANSSIKIPKDSPAQKNIILDGDAFFLIPREQEDSVFVYTRMLRIGTTGADFRIRARDESAGQTLEVLSGKSAVSKAYSSSFPDPEFPAAGEMIMINKDIDLMEKEKFDTSGLKSWLSDSLLLGRGNLQQAVKKLEDWFDIDLEISGNPPSEFKMNYLFVHTGLKSVLDSLSRNIKFSYRLKGNTAQIKF